METRIDKINGKITGVFFIVAAATAIAGLVLYDPILSHSDYLISGVRYSNQIILGALFELILACTAVGTAIMMFPYLRKYNESMGLGYVVFRVLEAVFILVGILSVLALLSLSHTFSRSPINDNSNFQAVGVVLKAIHEWTFMLGPNFMLGINTFIYSYVLYKTTLVPRPISTIGILAAVLIFSAALLEMFGVILQISFWGALLGVPIFFYEMTLAIWLILKGFNNKNLIRL